MDFDVARRRLLASYTFERVRAMCKYGFVFEDSRWEVRPAEGKGLGLFTSVPRRRGEVVFVAQGATRINHFEGEECYEYPDWYSVDKDTWVEIIDPYIRANHSCEPNLGLDGRRVFVALRDIAAGEELTYDYSVTDDELDWFMEEECRCHSSNCRKRIGAIQTLSAEEIQRIYPYIPPHMLKTWHEHQQQSKQ